MANRMLALIANPAIDVTWAVMVVAADRHCQTVITTGPYAIVRLQAVAPFR